MFNYTEYFVFESEVRPENQVCTCDPIETDEYLDEVIDCRSKDLWYDLGTLPENYFIVVTSINGEHGLPFDPIYF